MFSRKITELYEQKVFPAVGSDLSVTVIWFNRLIRTSCRRRVASDKYPTLKK